MRESYCEMICSTYAENLSLTLALFLDDNSNVVAPLTSFAGLSLILDTERVSDLVDNCNHLHKASKTMNDMEIVQSLISRIFSFDYVFLFIFFSLFF